MKSILIIRFPSNTSTADMIANREALGKNESLVADYHILTIVGCENKEVEFECFNSPHTEIEFEELKKKVMKMMDSQIKLSKKPQHTRYENKYQELRKSTPDINPRD